VISIDISGYPAREAADARHRPLVFVDLETTGGSATHDRITEVGLVEVGPSGIESWSTLLDPGLTISPAIERLTGISNAMVQHQPSFREVAEALAQRLDGKLLVAHNARFDYGFLKHEFKRAGMRFKVDTLCTVRLSRALFPRAERHGLDALIARLGLLPKGRHRALADADLLWQFWQKIHTLHSAETVETAVKSLIQPAGLPAALPVDSLAAVPVGPGIYVFYGDHDIPLYVGKSDTLKQRVAAHFSGAYRVTKEMRMAQQIRRIECRPTGGELGALLLEAQLVKQLTPAHNRLLRRHAVLYAWQWPHHALRPCLVSSKTVDFAHTPGLYGAFSSRLEAGETLRRIADEHQLCHLTLGLEAAHGTGGCSSYRRQRCLGCCAGDEDSAAHTQRALLALDTLRLKTWPHAGPVALFEAASVQAQDQTLPTTGQWHMLDNWCYLGSVEHQHQITAHLEQSAAVACFDRDIYAIVTRHQQLKQLPVHQLAALSSFELSAPEPAAASPKRRLRSRRDVADVAASIIKPTTHRTTAIAQLAFDL
jgi:DNA polymerase-3 subunit epsilon